MLNIYSKLRIFIPILIGFSCKAIMSRLCRDDDLTAKSNAKKLKIVPPSFVFSLVWIILYLTIGYTWYKEHNNKYVDLIFGINTILSALWLVLFSCEKSLKYSLYTILGIIATSLMMIQVSTNLISKLGLCLYSTWLIFAMIMNAKLVELTN